MEDETFENAIQILNEFPAEARKFVVNDDHAIILPGTITQRKTKIETGFEIL